MYRILPVYTDQVLTREKTHQVSSSNENKFQPNPRLGKVKLYDLVPNSTRTNL